MKELDVLVVGAGFSGMYMLHKVRQQGLRVQVFEAGSDVGGTWYWNRYPGARCDIESMEYSFQFDEELQQEWQWTERYSAQPEILNYAQHVAERFDLRSDITFNTRVERMIYDETGAKWKVTLDSGETIAARFVVAATGCLSVPSTPKISGADNFSGPIYHTGRWPHEPVDFTGKRVAVIGTGSSGIQSIPVIAEQAQQLTVFQRSPNYSVPAKNAPMDQNLQQRIKARYADFREINKLQPFGFGSRHPSNGGFVMDVPPAARREQFELHWNQGGLLFGGAFADIVFDAEANNEAAEFVRSKIRETVSDSEVAEKLCPDSTLFCKRLCADTNYFETYNKAHVQLVDINDTPIEEITSTGIRTHL